MANIRENKKNGKTVSYRFTVCLERDAQGKQVRKYTTWTPSEGLTPAKAKRAAERAAEEWEQETRAEYQKEQAAIAQGLAYQLPPEKRKGHASIAASFRVFSRLKSLWYLPATARQECR